MNQSMPDPGSKGGRGKDGRAGRTGEGRGKRRVGGTVNGPGENRISKIKNPIVGTCSFRSNFLLQVNRYPGIQVR